jgi:ferredoxin
MKTETASLVYFSPTSTTGIVLEEIARGMGQESPKVIDITRPEIRKQTAPVFENEVVLIGAPVYAGRVAKDAAAYIKTLKGSGSLAVVVVVYGNREFEDALLELKNMAVDSGFVVLAGGAFIGEHSFSDTEFSIAPGRPDEADLEKAFLFGQKIAGMLNSLETPADVLDVEVPGNFPYKEGMGDGAFAFIDVTDDCDDCGICAPACPKEAINEADHYSTIDARCIFCCACIKACPQQARIMKAGPMKDKAKWLSENCAQRKEPQTFF